MDEMIEATPENLGFLDTVAARVLALVIAGISAFLLLLAHQHYQGTTGGVLGGVDRAAFDACIDERMAAFDRLAAQAGYSDERRAAAQQAATASAKVVCAEMARPGEK